VENKTSEKYPQRTFFKFDSKINLKTAVSLKYVIRSIFPIKIILL